MAEMTQVEGAQRAQGLLSRIVGIVVSPRDTFGAVGKGLTIEAARRYGPAA